MSRARTAWPERQYCTTAALELLPFLYCLPRITSAPSYELLPGPSTAFAPYSSPWPLTPATAIQHRTAIMVISSGTAPSKPPGGTPKPTSAPHAQLWANHSGSSDNSPIHATGLANHRPSSAINVWCLPLWPFSGAHETDVPRLFKDLQSLLSSSPLLLLLPWALPSDKMAVEWSSSPSSVNPPPPSAFLLIPTANQSFPFIEILCTPTLPLELPPFVSDPSTLAQSKFDHGRNLPFNQIRRSFPLKPRRWRFPSARGQGCRSTHRRVAWVPLRPRPCPQILDEEPPFCQQSPPTKLPLFCRRREMTRSDPCQIWPVGPVGPTVSDPRAYRDALKWKCILQSTFSLLESVNSTEKFSV